MKTLDLKKRPSRARAAFLMNIIRAKAWPGWRWYWKGRIPK